MDEDDDLSHTEFPNACSLVGIELDKVPRRLALWIVDWIVDWIGQSNGPHQFLANYTRTRPRPATSTAGMQTLG